MQRNKLTRVLAATAALAVFGAACGGGDDTTTEPTEGESTPEPMAGGDVSTYIAEPEHLFPQNTNESEGAAVLRALFKGLVDYDVRTTTMQLQVAESIDTTDNQNYTVTLKDGWTFHNGDPVTAASFVNAWNFAADADNAMGTRSFFASIVGFVDEGDGADADTLEGLAVVDDTSFTIALKNPDPSFPIQLGYTAFFPLPDVALTDPVAFEEAPIGNGPFMIDGTWVHDEQIRTVRYDDYAGSEPALLDSLTFRIFADQAAAYNALLAGEIDIMDSLPAENIDEARGTFGDHFGESPSSSINYLGMPSYVEWLTPDIRRALSMAIDKDLITQGPIFNGNRASANSFISPVIPGHRDTVCDNWSYDVDAAKALWDGAGGYEGDITVWFNSGAGHDAWVESVTNQWVTNLGVSPDQIKFESLEFADYLPKIDGKGLTGPFRLGWGMDYPHPQNYIEPIFSSANFAPDGSNSTFTADDTIDGLIAQGNAATTLEEAIPFFQQAEDQICAEVYVIPMFFGLNQFASTQKVQNLYVDAFGDINYTGISVAA